MGDELMPFKKTTATHQLSCTTTLNDPLYPFQHGSPAEAEPAPAFYTHHPNTTETTQNQGPKLYSKVLTIEPNRLLKI